MEPNKLEQDIQQKLQQRTIMPSAAAWDRLDAMLTIAEQQATPPAEEPKTITVKKKSNRNWLYMAAAFLLLLGGGFFFTQQQTTQTIIDNTAPQVVTNETEQPNIENQTNDITPVDSPAAKTAIIVHTAKRTSVASASVEEKQIEAVVTENKVETQEIAQNVTVETPANSENTEVKQRSLRVDPAALLASVENKKQGHTPAVANISQPKIKVNANNLLNNVEAELDDNFRNKVLNSIEKKYKAVKSAVVSRNRE